MARNKVLHRREGRYWDLPLRIFGRKKWQKLFSAGVEALQRGDLNEAEAQLAQAMEKADEMGPDFLAVADTSYVLARVYYAQRRLEEARRNDQRSFSLRLQELGPDDQRTIQSYLAVLESPEPPAHLDESLLRAALLLCREQYGPTDWRAGRVIANLLTQLQESDEEIRELACEAEEVCRFSFNEGRAELGKTPDISGPLGEACKALGYFDLAAPFFAYSARYQEELIGPKTEGHAWALFKLGACLEKAGHPEEASEALSRSLEIQEMKLPPGHELTKATVNMMALSLSSLGRVAEAGQFFARALESIPEGNRDARARCLLGLLQAACLKTDGERERQKLLADLTTLTDEISPPALEFTAAGATRAAEFLVNLWRDDEAGQILSKALGWSRKAYGPRHPLIAHILLQQARLALYRGDQSEAHQMIQQALSVDESVAIQVETSWLLAQMGREEEAGQHSQLAVRMLRAVETESQAGELYLRLAEAQLANYNPDGAGRALRKAYELFDSVWQSWSQVVMGRLACWRGHLTDGLRLMATALKALEEKPEFLYQRVQAYHQMAAIHLLAGQLEQAEQLADLALAKLPEGHPETLPTRALNAAVARYQGRGYEAQIEAQRLLAELDGVSVKGGFRRLEVLMWLAPLLAELGQASQAELLCLEGLKSAGFPTSRISLDPFPDVALPFLLGLARAHQRQNQDKQARIRAQVLLSRAEAVFEPGDPRSVFIRLGALAGLESSARLELATHLREGLERDSASPRTWRLLALEGVATAQAGLGQADEARQTAELGLALGKSETLEELLVPPSEVEAVNQPEESLEAEEEPGREDSPQVEEEPGQEDSPQVEEEPGQEDSPQVEEEPDQEERQAEEEPGEDQPQLSWEVEAPAELPKAEVESAPTAADSPPGESPTALEEVEPEPRETPEPELVEEAHEPEPTESAPEVVSVAHNVPLEIPSVAELLAQEQPPTHEKVVASLGECVARFGRSSWQAAVVVANFANCFPVDSEEAIAYEEQAMELYLEWLETEPDEGLVDPAEQLAEQARQMGRLESSLGWHAASMQFVQARFGAGSAESADVLLRLGSIYEQAQQFEDAAGVYREALTTFESWFGPRSQRLLPVLEKMARVSQGLGDNELSLELLQQRLEILDPVSQRSDTAETLHLAMSVAHRCGQWEQASQSRECFLALLPELPEAERVHSLEKLVDFGRYLQEEFWAPREAEAIVAEARERLEGLSIRPFRQLALVEAETALHFHYKGLEQRASESLEKSRAISRELDDAGRLPVLVRLSEVAECLGDNDLARQLAERCLELEVSSAGKQSSGASKALLRLAQLDLAGYRLEAAETAVAMARPGLGSDDQLGASRTQAQTLALMRRFPEAEELFRQLVDGAGDRRDLRSLAEILLAQDKFQEAEDLVGERVHLDEAVDHPEDALDLMVMGSVLLEKGDVQRAGPYVDRAFEIITNRVERDDPRRIPFLTQMARWKLACGETAAASRFCQEAYELKPPVGVDLRYGLSTFPVYEMLVETAVARGDFKQAERMAEIAHLQASEFLGEEDVNTNIGLDLQARVALAKGSLDQAESHWTEAIDLARPFLGDEHTFLAGCVRGLAEVSLVREEWGSARTYAAEARRLEEKLRGDSLQLIRATIVAIEIEKRFDLGEAEYLADLTRDVSSELLGSEHPLYLRLENLLAEVNSLLEHSIADTDSVPRPETVSPQSEAESSTELELEDPGANEESEAEEAEAIDIPSPAEVADSEVVEAAQEPEEAEEVEPAEVVVEAELELAGGSEQADLVEQATGSEETETTEETGAADPEAPESAEEESELSEEGESEDTEPAEEEDEDEDDGEPKPPIRRLGSLLKKIQGRKDRPGRRRSSFKLKRSGSSKLKALLAKRDSGEEDSSEEEPEQSSGVVAAAESAQQAVETSPESAPKKTLRPLLKRASKPRRGPIRPRSYVETSLELIPEPQRSEPPEPEDQAFRETPFREETEPLPRPAAALADPALALAPPIPVFSQPLVELAPVGQLAESDAILLESVREAVREGMGVDQAVRACLAGLRPGRETVDLGRGLIGLAARLYANNFIADCAKLARAGEILAQEDFRAQIAAAQLRGRMCVLQGRFVRGQELLDTAHQQALSSEEVPRAERAQLAVDLANCLRHQEKFEQALEYLNEAFDVLAEEVPKAQAIVIQCSLALLNLCCAKPSDSDRLVKRALSHLEGEGPGGYTSLSWMYLAKISLWKGDIQAGLQSIERALTERGPDTSHEGPLLATQCDLLLAAGRGEEAEVVARELATLVPPELEPLAQLRLAFALLLQRKFPQAEFRLRLARQMGEDVLEDDHPWRTWPLEGMAEMAVAQGDHQLAQRLAKEIADMVQPAGEVRQSRHLYRLSRVHTRLGENEKAEELLAQARHKRPSLA